MKTSLLLGSYAIISTLILTEASLPALANPRSPKPPEFETKVLLRGLQHPTGIAFREVISTSPQSQTRAHPMPGTR
ncbi:MAG: hypothetical protein FJ405_06200 [Verrucomicrobia bacterium]|nr:hypothetical protein [Verrucomicrobiota bacterium]